MHRPQFFTWTTHTAETTTLLEATRLQKLYTYMCNIVTEFYLYSIVYIYLINSRLDVTHSVHHHFRTIQTLSYWRCKERVYSLVDSNWDLKSSFNPSQLQPAQQELQNRGMKIQNTVVLIHTLSFLIHFQKSYGEQRQDPG